MKLCLTPILITLYLLTTMVSCSKSTDSDDRGDGDDRSLIASETIGSEGGVLGTDVFTLTVPAGALGSSSTLKLYQDKSERPFESEQLSETYVLEGLPQDYAGTVTLCLKCNDALSGNGVIAVGEENFLSLADEGSVLYSLFPAVDSSGHLIAEIPAPQGPAASYKSLAKSARSNAHPSVRKLMAVGNTHTPASSADGNFTIHYPADLNSDYRDYMASDLAEALQKIEALGFKTWGLSLPIDVYVSPLEDRDENRCVAFLPIYGKHCIYVDKKRMQDPVNFYDNIDYGMGRELFHLILSTYDPEYFTFTGAEQTVNLDHFWFHTAVTHWSEFLYGTNIEAIPIAFWGDDFLFMGKRGYAPFKGIAKGVGTTRYSAYEHGCGMTGMFKYLVDTYGTSIIINTYDDIFNNGRHPVTALLNSINDPVSEWWPAFIRSYLAGNIYKHEALGRFGEYGEGLNVVSNQLFRVRNAADTSHIFAAIPPDISATDMYVSLENNDLSNAAMIKADLDVLIGNPDKTILMAYGYTLNQQDFDMDLQPFEEATREITISNIKDLMTAKCEYIVLVLTNADHNGSDYKGEATALVSARVLTPAFIYNSCVFDIYCDMTIKSVSSSGETVWTTDMAKVCMCVDGYFQGNTYIGELDPRSHYTETGTVEITIDPETYDVTEFVINTSQDDTGLLQSWSIESKGAANVPLTWRSPFDDAQENELYGQAVCDISTVEMFWQFAGSTQTVEGISCNSTSHITIRFDDTNSEI